MAEIYPFRGWRYNPTIGNISELTFPLAGSNPKLDKLASPLNIINIFFPPEINQARATLDKWKENKILIQEDRPAIYIYEQSYIAKDNSIRKLRGFICNLKLYEWNENIVLRHEMTMPHSVKERLEILSTIQMNICPTHGLYTDTTLTLEPYLEKSLSQPIHQFKDSSGIDTVFSAIYDPEIITHFISIIKEKQIIIADGHHRYEASLKYRNLLKSDSNSANPENSHLIFLTNTESNQFDIYPTHRLISDLPNFEKNKFLDNLLPYFEVSKIEPANVYREVRIRHHAFGLVFQDQTFIATLKEGLENKITWKFPSVIRELDLTILHYYIVEKGLGIEGKDQKYSRNIQFSFDYHKILEDVRKGNFQMAILTKDVSQEEIKKVCYSGFTLPHKSTYFYPKVLCGLVMSSLKP